MGLLDDAIREHLELKRRHGADPDEVARQEHEALGETRRAEFARPEGAEGVAVPDERHDDVPDDVAEAAPTAEHEVEDAPASHEPFDVEADEPPAAAAEPPATTEPAAPPAADDPWLAEERDEVPADEALDHPRGGDEEVGGADEEVRAGDEEVRARDADVRARDEDVRARDKDEGAGDDADEDVLEETPDFLQETPEHDRLWFEQRPPRDFDWDK
jgi:hypothetical protein